MNKPPGWRNESARHGLAARGIKTRQDVGGQRQRRYWDLVISKEICPDCGEPVNGEDGVPGRLLTGQEVIEVIRCLSCVRRKEMELRELQLESLARYPHNY